MILVAVRPQKHCVQDTQVVLNLSDLLTFSPTQQSENCAIA